jgi:hypothetical protein
VTNYTNSALYATSPDAMAAEEMGLPTRPARPDWDVNPYGVDLEDCNPYSDREETYVPTREECGEIVFQQIRSLMEDGHSQVLTREHAAEIAAYALKLLS